MDRLKKRPAESPVEDGELVTRADGSQAIRVRKKKRRTRQPHKEERRNQLRARMFQVSGALILLLLAIFAAGSRHRLRQQRAVPRKAGRTKSRRSTGAEAELRQFRMNPSTANASGLTLTWPQGNVLETLTLRGIKAEHLPGQLPRKIHGRRGSDRRRGHARRCAVPQPGEPMRARSGPGDEPPPVRFDQYTDRQIPRCSSEIPPRRGSACGTPRPPSFRMRPPQPRSCSSPVATSSSRDWPKLRMDRSHIEFRGDETDIVSMRLRHETDSRGALRTQRNRLALDRRTAPPRSRSNSIHSSFPASPARNSASCSPDGSIRSPPAVPNALTFTSGDEATRLPGRRLPQQPRPTLRSQRLPLPLRTFADPARRLVRQARFRWCQSRPDPPPDGVVSH